MILALLLAEAGTKILPVSVFEFLERKAMILGAGGLYLDGAHEGGNAAGSFKVKTFKNSKYSRIVV